MSGAPGLNAELLGCDAAEGVDGHRAVAQAVPVDHHSGADFGLLTKLQGQCLNGGRRYTADLFSVFRGDFLDFVC